MVALLAKSQKNHGSLLTLCCCTRINIAYLKIESITGEKSDENKANIG